MFSNLTTVQTSSLSSRLSKKSQISSAIARRSLVSVSCGISFTPTPKVRVGKKKDTFILFATPAEDKSQTSEDSKPVEPAESTETVADVLKAQKAQQKKRSRPPPDSTDFVASALTRRFGLAGGLAWLGVLTFGVVSEQIKTRRENFIAERDTKEVTSAKEVVTASGLRWVDKVVGGGERPETGLIVGLTYTLSVDDKVILDTTRRPQIVLMGRKPYSGGLCAGTDEALRSMRAGGRRIITVPPELAFGEQGALFGQAVIPPNATVVYDLSVQRVSIAPS